MGVDRVGEREHAQPVGQHAVIELHRQGVLEEVPPPWLAEQKVCGRRDEAAVDQRPGVVDQPGAQSRHQGAEIDLGDDEGEQRARAPAQPPRHRRRAATAPAPRPLRERSAVQASAA